MGASKSRIERDSMGEMEVPSDALYGAQTRRAELNFPISGWRMPRGFIRALGLIKKAAAQVNAGLGKLDYEKANLITVAAGEVIDGKLDDQFIVDVFQTGSGTSSNMNANEVIANRAIQLAGGEVGSKVPVHPNDHVNMGQSSNDVIPTAIHIAASEAIAKDLLPALGALLETLDNKAEEFDAVVAIGRTHLQDAVPITLGQIFSGYAAQVANASVRLEQALLSLSELPIGGTAVGTGLNTHREFGTKMADALSEATGIGFNETMNHFEAQGAKDAIVETASILKTIAVSLTKIANDIRFLASGPRCGIGEIKLPATQPGSSIMPGKINPVMCESVMQVASYVVGADAGIAYAAATLSNFELCTGMPYMAYQLLESIRLLSNVCRAFEEKCVRGIEANEGRCAELIETSLAMVTGLAPLIGYDKAAEIARAAYESGRNVREVGYEMSGLDKETIDRALNPRSMTEGG
jgi:fumarate hydratase class II